MNIHDASSPAGATLAGKRVLAVLPPGNRDLGKYLISVVQAGKARWSWNVSVLCPTADTRPFQAVAAPDGETILPPHFLRVMDWESDPRQVEELDKRIREAEVETGLSAGRVILASGHTIGRAYSFPVAHINRYPMVLEPLADNSESLRVVRRFYRFAEDLLDRVKPDFVFFFHWAVLPNLVVWLAARRRGIPCIALRPSKILHDHGFWTMNTLMLNDAAFEIANAKRSAGAAVSEGSLERVRAFGRQPSMIKYIATKWKSRSSISFVHWHLRYARIVAAQFMNRRRGQDRATEEPPLGRLFRFYRTQFLSSRHQKVFKAPDVEYLEKTKYIYFPMHKEAELAQTFQASTWHDQRNTIRLLASVLPFGYKLLIREHRMNFGRRRTSAYRELAQLPNVVLIDPFDSQFKYLKHAALVVTENGSSGWEGLLLQRRVLLLSDAHFYQGCGQGVTVIDPDRLNAKLLDMLAREPVADPEAHDRALAAMIDAEHETTFPMKPEGMTDCLDRLDGVLSPLLRKPASAPATAKL